MDEEKKEQTSEQEIDIEKIKKERDEYLEGWKRAKADFVNYKKEEAERMNRSTETIKKIVILDILPTLDSFELGIMSATDEHSRKGMELIRLQLEEALKRNGLEKISTHAGQQFDPSYHEAVGEVESEYPEGTIAEEISTGYLLSGRVIRPARVNISKGSKTK